MEKIRRFISPEEQKELDEIENYKREEREKFESLKQDILEILDNVNNKEMYTKELQDELIKKVGKEKFHAGELMNAMYELETEKRIEIVKDSEDAFLYRNKIRKL